MHPRHDTSAVVCEHASAHRGSPPGPPVRYSAGVPLPASCEDKPPIDGFEPTCRYVLRVRTLGSSALASIGLCLSAPPLLYRPSTSGTGHRRLHKPSRTQVLLRLRAKLGHSGGCSTL
ncbi:hypothetical protein C2E23DRAFT_825590 [Lenzites betulinus]|nr:hypothetical protein C2E23DRAFT_825590 [Lenzites betulinus]